MLKQNSTVRSKEFLEAAVVFNMIRSWMAIVPLSLAVQQVAGAQSVTLAVVDGQL